MNFLFFYIIKGILSSCSFRSNIIWVENDSFISNFKYQNRSIFLRLISPKYFYSKVSQDQWEKLAEIFPQVDFITINCGQNTAVCSLFNDDIAYPYYGFVPGNLSIPINDNDAKFGINETYNVESTPQHYIDIIYKYSNLYPISPPLFALIPSTTDSFYLNAANPIFILYNSDCYEQIEFINVWSKAANEFLYLSSDAPTVGLLDCTLYFDECKRWFSLETVLTPSALIYSRKTGNYKLFDNNLSHITKEQLNNLMKSSDQLPQKPTPSPYPNSQALFELKYESEEGEEDLCFYNSNPDTCNPKIDLSNRFGPNHYQIDFFKSSQKNLRIQISEPIKLNDELFITAQQKFEFVGCKINGRLRIDVGVFVKIQDPSETNVIINWKVKSDEIGHLNCTESPRSLMVQVLDETEEVSSNKKKRFYIGKLNRCSLSKSIFRGENKDVYYSISEINSWFYLTFFVVNSCDVFSDFQLDESEVNPIQIKDVRDMINQKSNKRKIKVYTSKYITNIDINSFIPDSTVKRDYEFITKGSYFQVTCDMKIKSFINTITFSGYDYGNYHQDFALYYNASTTTNNQCELDKSIIIKKFGFQSSTFSDEFDPISIKDSISMKQDYINESDCDIYPVSGQDEQVIDAAPTGPRKRFCIVNVGDRFSEYTILIDAKYPFKNRYDTMIIRPYSQVPSNITITIADKSDQNTVIPNYFTTFNVIYENFVNLKINNPIYKGTMSFHRCYNFSNVARVHFINYGVVSDDSDTDIHVELKNPFSLIGNYDAYKETAIHYGVSTDLAHFSVLEDGIYVIPNLVTRDVYSRAGMKRFDRIKVTKSITADSCYVRFNLCEIDDGIELHLNKIDANWPFVSILSGDKLKPSKVIINVDESRPPTDDTENHLLVEGISSCDGFIEKVSHNLDSTWRIQCSDGSLYARGGYDPTSHPPTPATRTATPATRSMAPTRTPIATRTLAPTRTLEPTRTRTPSESPRPTRTKIQTEMTLTPYTEAPPPQTATQTYSDASSSSSGAIIPTRTESGFSSSSPDVTEPTQMSHSLTPYPGLGNSSGVSRYINGKLPTPVIVGFIFIGVCFLVVTIVVIVSLKTQCYKAQARIQNTSD